MKRYHNDIEQCESSESNGPTNECPSDTTDRKNLSLYDVMEGDQHSAKNDPDHFTNGETSRLCSSGGDPEKNEFEHSQQSTNEQSSNSNSNPQSHDDESFVSLKVPKIDPSIVQKTSELSSTSYSSSEESKISKQSESEEETSKCNDAIVFNKLDDGFGDIKSSAEGATNTRNLGSENDPEVGHCLHPEILSDPNIQAMPNGSSDCPSKIKPDVTLETQTPAEALPSCDGILNSQSTSNEGIEEAENSVSENENNSVQTEIAEAVADWEAPEESSAGIRVCTDTWHTSMCRAPSPKYYQGTDIDDLVSETEDTLGGAVFSERVPDLIHDDLDSEDFAMYSDHELSSSVSSASSHSAATTNASFPNRTSNVSDDTGEYNITEGDASRPINEENREGEGNDSNPEIADLFSEDEEPSIDMRFMRRRFRVGGGDNERRRKMSTVKEPHPYIPPPVPVHNWRSYQHMFRYRRGIISPEKHKVEIQRSQHFVQRWEREFSLVGHRGCVNSLNFNESGTTLVSGGDDLTVILWDWNKRKKRSQYESGHHSNVFHAKFLPHCNDTSIVTCARDGQIRHASLSSTGAAFTSKLAQHKLSAHKLAILRDSPCEFLSSGEDGYVFHLDVRRTNTKKPLPILTVTNEKDRPIELYSIDSSPSNENFFLVCGHDPNVFIYDRRFLEHGPVCKYRPDNIGEDDYRMSITGATYSKLGTEIAASYSDEDVYVFDVDLHQLPCNSEDSSPSCSFQEDSRKRKYGAADLLDGPLNTKPKRFSGHRNCQTVKSVQFLGPSSEFVVSGSDDGHIYVWDKHTQKTVQWLHGDEAGVVNVLEPHPSLPYMATSGLDHTVKIWSPVRGKPNNLQGLASVMAQNKKERESDPTRDGMFDARMLMLLMQSLSSSERRQMEGLEPDPDDSDAEANNEDGTGEENNSEAARASRTVGCRTS